MAGKPAIRTAYDGVRVADDDVFFPADAVGAKQSFRAECDVNNIVKSFNPRTGEFSHMALKAPIFGDTTGMDFREMMELMVEAQASFEQLPAETRARFGNDPQTFVSFCQEPGNVPELLALGLAVEGQVVQPVRVVVEPSPSVGTMPPVAAVLEAPGVVGVPKA
jgi:phage internal scaffolding protein